jgi:hypothetical protein
VPRLWGGEEQEARKAAASLGAGGERKGMGVEVRWVLLSQSPSGRLCKGLRLVLASLLLMIGR